MVLRWRAGLAIRFGGIKPHDAKIMRRLWYGLGTGEKYAVITVITS